ncbi:MAG: Flp pilus assembly protein CpaB [Myxococcota bacterium]
MNRKALAAGVFVSLVGIVLLFLYMRRYEKEASGGEPVRVLMVTADYAAGEPITSEGLAVRELPTAYIEDRHVRARDQSEVLGIRTAHGLSANQSLLWTDLDTAIERRRELSTRLREGMRAMTVAVDRDESIVALINPGDRVDLLYTGLRSTQVDRDETEQVTINLLQNVLVLAVGLDTGGQADENTRASQADISVALTVEQAALVTHALENGRIGLALRNTGDIGIVEDLPDVTNDNLIQPLERQRIQRRRRATMEPEAIEQIGGGGRRRR